MPLNPSLARVAGSAFHNNRHRKGSDMYCNPHGLTPSRVVGLNPPTVLWQRLPVVYTGCRNLSTGANRVGPGVPHGAVWGVFAARDGRLFLLWEDGIVHAGDCVVPTGEYLNDVVHAILVLSNSRSYGMVDGMEHVSAMTIRLFPGVHLQSGQLVK